jgi:DNA repair exonuclease SbcCD ATPase subunit
MINIAELEKKGKALQNSLASLEGQEKLLEEQLASNNKKLVALAHKKEVYTKSIEIITLIQETTQQQIREGFEKLVTYALQYIFAENYQFKLEFDRRGNLQECNFKFISPEGVEITDPMDALGGGIMDVASIALRVALLELHKPKNTSFLALDEPTRNVSAEFIPKCGNFFKELNNKLHRQIIVVTHQEALMAKADTQITIGIKSTKDFDD